MGILFDTVQRLDRLIERKGLPHARTKGLVVIKAGFSLVLVRPDTPDDPAKVRALQQAIRAVVGEEAAGEL